MKARYTAAEKAAVLWIVAQAMERTGWAVRRIKIDDGCYEIDGRDADGRRIEVTVHPATLQVIKFEYDDDVPRQDRDGRNDD